MAAQFARPQRATAKHNRDRLRLRTIARQSYQLPEDVMTLMSCPSLCPVESGSTGKIKPPADRDLLGPSNSRIPTQCHRRLHRFGHLVLFIPARCCLWALRRNNAKRINQRQSPISHLYVTLVYVTIYRSASSAFSYSECRRLHVTAFEVAVVRCRNCK